MTYKKYISFGNIKIFILYIIISSLIGKSSHYKKLTKHLGYLSSFPTKNYKVLSKTETKKRQVPKVFACKSDRKKAFLFNSVKPSGPVKKDDQVNDCVAWIYSDVLSVSNHSLGQYKHKTSQDTWIVYLHVNFFLISSSSSFIEQICTCRKMCSNFVRIIYIYIIYTHYCTN